MEMVSFSCPSEDCRVVWFKTHTRTTKNVRRKINISYENSLFTSKIHEKTHNFFFRVEFCFSFLLNLHVNNFFSLKLLGTFLAFMYEIQIIGEVKWEKSQNYQKPPYPCLIRLM